MFKMDKYQWVVLYFRSEKERNSWIADNIDIITEGMPVCIHDTNVAFQPRVYTDDLVIEILLRVMRDRANGVIAMVHIRSHPPLWWIERNWEREEDRQ